MSADKKYKLDLFGKLLPALDRRDFSLWRKLTEEERAGFADIVALRYMSCVSDTNPFCEYYIEAANEFGNQHLWNSHIRNHPGLKYLMLACVGVGEKTNHQWIKGPSRPKNDKVREMLKAFYPTANREEINMMLEMNTDEELLEMAEMMGYQADQIKQLKQDIKKVKS